MEDRTARDGTAPHDPVADSRGNWVDVRAPEQARPYCRLARLDRPIGTWLLLWPCWWSLAMAAMATGSAVPDPLPIVLFGIGAVVMRGAGCTYNDLVDRDFDALVARTRSRPIPSGQVTVARARAFMALQCLAGLFVLVQFNWFAVALGASSLIFVAIYPFMKRFTYWPQLFLGFAFNWGALLGWASVTGALAPAPIVLYIAGISWTLGYDTIYAHQDKEDDALIGIKSTALKFGDRTKSWMTLFYMVAIIGITLAGLLAAGGYIFLAGMAVAAGHLTWQIRTLHIEDGERCLKLFRSNRYFGAIVFAAIVAESLYRSLG